AADGQSADDVDRLTGRGDGDQTGHDARGRAQRGGLAVAGLLHHEPGQQRRTGGDDGGEGGGTGDDVGARCGTGVDGESAEPQRTGTEQDAGQVVRTDRGLGPALAVAEHDCQHQARRTGVDVHGGTTGEVDGLQVVGDPATGLGGDAVEGEDPVRDREVDDG